MPFVSGEETVKNAAQLLRIEPKTNVAMSADTFVNRKDHLFGHIVVM